MTPPTIVHRDQCIAMGIDPDNLPPHLVLAQPKPLEPFTLDEDRRYALIDEDNNEVEMSQEQIDGILLRKKEVMNTHGAGAQVVTPYKPNRKQRRCQEHAKKAAKSKPTKKRRW